MSDDSVERFLGQARAGANALAACRDAKARYEEYLASGESAVNAIDRIMYPILYVHRYFPDLTAERTP